MLKKKRGVQSLSISTVVIVMSTTKSYKLQPVKSFEESR